jgi:hypothetical protein
MKVGEVLEQAAGRFLGRRLADFQNAVRQIFSTAPRRLSDTFFRCDQQSTVHAYHREGHHMKRDYQTRNKVTAVANGKSNSAVC